MFSLKPVLFIVVGFPLGATLLGLLQHEPVAGTARLVCCWLALVIAAFGLSLVAGAQSPIEARAIRPVNSEIGDSDESFHFVGLSGREIHAKIGDVAGFDAKHLYPFVIRKI